MLMLRIVNILALVKVNTLSIVKLNNYCAISCTESSLCNI